MAAALTNGVAHSVTHSVPVTSSSHVLPSHAGLSHDDASTAAAAAGLQQPWQQQALPCAPVHSRRKRSRHADTCLSAAPVRANLRQLLQPRDATQSLPDGPIPADVLQPNEVAFILRYPKNPPTGTFPPRIAATADGTSYECFFQPCLNGLFSDSQRRKRHCFRCSAGSKASQTERDEQYNKVVQHIRQSCYPKLKELVDRRASTPGPVAPQVLAASVGVTICSRELTYDLTSRCIAPANGLLRAHCPYTQTSHVVLQPDSSAHSAPLQLNHAASITVVDGVASQCTILHGTVTLPPVCYVERTAWVSNQPFDVCVAASRASARAVEPCGRVHSLPTQFIDISQQVHAANRPTMTRAICIVDLSALRYPSPSPATATAALVPSPLPPLPTYHAAAAASAVSGMRATHAAVSSASEPIRLDVHRQFSNGFLSLRHGVAAAVVTSHQKGHLTLRLRFNSVHTPKLDTVQREVLRLAPDLDPDPAALQDMCTAVWHVGYPTPEENLAWISSPAHEEVAWLAQPQVIEWQIPPLLLHPFHAYMLKWTWRTQWEPSVYTDQHMNSPGNADQSTSRSFNSVHTSYGVL